MRARPDGGAVVNPGAVSDRHPSLVRICAHLDAMIAAQAAAGCGDPPQSGGVMWAAPAFGWALAAIDVGRKDRAADGTRLLLPVRLTWDTPVVFVPTGGEVAHLTWSTCAMGHQASGRTEVRVRENLPEPVVEYDDWGIPTRVLRSPTSVGRCGRSSMRWPRRAVRPGGRC